MIDLGNTPAAPTPTLSEQAQIRFALGIKQLAIVNPATNIAAFLEEPTSQRLADALVDENGDGPLAFANNGTHTNATLGGTLTINSTTINLGAGVADSIKDALGLGDLQDVLDSKADISNPVRTTLTGNGTQTVFAISGAGTLSNPSALIVAIDGALQEPSVDYTVGGGNITFTDPLASGAKAVVIAPSNSIQVGELIPSDGSVTSAKLAPNLTLTNATFGGTAAFTGTARPTSAAVGSPAATDLMTRNDVGMESFFNLGRVFRPAVVPAFASSGTGSGANTLAGDRWINLVSGTANNGWARATIARGITTNPSYSGGGIGFGRPLGVSIVMFFTLTASSNVFRLRFGSDQTPPPDGSDPVSYRSFGLEIKATTFWVWRVYAHNGTSITYSEWTNSPIPLNQLNTRVYASVISNGAGQITGYLGVNGDRSLSQLSINGGPTTNGAATQAFVDVHVANTPTGTVSGSAAVQDAMIYAL
jgi:hypothetical protein